MYDVRLVSNEISPVDFGHRARRRLLILLIVAYAFSFIDRTILATIGQAIKADLKISDTQLGLLGGLYFALLYTLLGIPLARVAERVSRVEVITGAIVVWSAFTALCGIAGSFVTLAALRFGVGVGEAGLTPPAHSLISDYFEPHKRGWALSIVNLGVPLGIMVGAIAGGWLTQNFSWRVAFIIVGLPGAFLALAVKLYLPEPPRGLWDQSTTLSKPVARNTSPALAGMSLVGELREIGGTCATLFGEWPILSMVLGATIASIAGYGAGAFIPAHFVRTFGLDFTHVGLVYGLIYGLAPGIGVLAGGFLADRLGAYNARWYALTPALGLLLGAPAYVWAFTQGSWQATAAGQFLPLLIVAGYLGPTFGVVQNVVEPRRRATAAAILVFVINLVALGAGPPLTGWVIDHLAAFNLEHSTAHSIWSGLKSLAAAHVTDFQRSCPGGVAPAGAAPGMDIQCKTALALATRQGIMVALGCYFWGGIPYLIATFGLERVLGRVGQTVR